MDFPRLKSQSMINNLSLFKNRYKVTYVLLHYPETVGHACMLNTVDHQLSALRFQGADFMGGTYPLQARSSLATRSLHLLHL